MKRTITKLTLLTAIVSLSSCARQCQKFERNTYDNKTHNVTVTHFSGGRPVGQWTFNGIINSSQSSDGYFFYYNGKLIEISGDVRIEYLD